MNNNSLWKWWKTIDKPIVLSLVIIFAFSILMVATASPSVAARIGLNEFYFTYRHIIYLFLATLVIFLISNMDEKAIKRFAILGYVASLLLVILVQFKGYEIKGAKRWINMVGLSIQPSEFMKPFLAIVTAWLLSLKETNNMVTIIIALAIYLVSAALLIMQPDFGMFVMVSSVFGIQLFVSGLPIIFIILAMVLLSLGVFTAYLTIPHVAQRIENFINPASGENYQISKSILAYEHGGFYGTGPGEGTVKQSLPDAHADFIFAVAGEEFGVLICLLITSIFAFITIRGFYRIFGENNKFVFYAVIGILSQFSIQTIINLGVTLNLLPTKGMTLPFISYGGSSTIALACGMGMLIALLRREIVFKKYKLRLP